MDHGRTIDWTGPVRRAARWASAVLLVCAGALPAHAASISIVPSATTVGVGATFSIDVVVDDLGDEIVSGFDLDLLYDASLFSATAIDFGTGLGLDEFLQFPSSVFSAGRVDFANLALYSDDELAAFQGTSVLLARLTFGVLAEGSGLFAFDATTPPGVLATGRDALPLEFGSVGTATVRSSRPIDVPEPASGALALLAVLGFALARRHARR